MTLHITRKCIRNTRQYSVQENNHIKGTANETREFSLSRIFVYDDDTCVLAARQDDPSKRFQPFLTLRNALGRCFVPYKIYAGQNLIGRSAPLKLGRDHNFSIDGCIYRCMIHSHGFISFWKDGIQVALSFSEFGLGRYTVQYDPFHERAEHILLLFCMIIDTLEFPNLGKYTIISFDKSMDYALEWKPKS